MLPPARGRGTEIRPAAIAPDGSLILSNGRSLQRLDPSGRLDQGFGEDGVVTPPAPDERRFEITGVAIDAKQQIVVVGTSYRPQPPRTEPMPSSPSFETSARILRYLPGGALDSSFADSGILETDFGLPAPESEGLQIATAPIVEATGVAIDRSGRIVVSGGAAAGLRDACAHDWYFDTVTYAAFVARLTESGALDADFGGGDGVFGGHRASENPRRIEVASPPALAPDGGVTFMRGQGACPRARGAPGAVQLTNAGVPIEARVALRHRWIAAMAVAPDGSVVLLENPDYRAQKPGHQRVLRIRPDGALDKAFGRAGRAAVPLSGGEYVDSIAVDSQNEVLLAGTKSVVADQISKGRGQPRVSPSALLLRLRPLGQLDAKFGAMGAIVTRFPALYGVAGLWLDGQRRVTVTGTYRRPGVGRGLAAVRYVVGD
jgi:uncharacterized delta-60 repeat protein